MMQPKGFVVEGEAHFICKLKKSIYGNRLDAGMSLLIFSPQNKMGFIQSTEYPCIYIDAGGDVFYIGVYVDDIILAGRTDK